MNSNERILEQLRKKLEGYRDSKESLNHRIVHLTLQFNSISKLIIETEEAIAALEGKTTETRRVIEEAIKQNVNPTPSRLLPAAMPPKLDTKDEGLWHNGVMAEPGFHWVNGNLVPESIPTTGTYDEKAFVELPPVDDAFEEIDPMQFNPKI